MTWGRAAQFPEVVLQFPHLMLGKLAGGQGILLYICVVPWLVCSANPGYWFQVAGWRKRRTTARGPIELEKFPAA